VKVSQIYTQNAVKLVAELDPSPTEGFKACCQLCFWSTESRQWNTHSTCCSYLKFTLSNRQRVILLSLSIHPVTSCSGSLLNGLYVCASPLVFFSTRLLQRMLALSLLLWLF